MRISKYEAKKIRAERKKAQEGKGRFIYENNTKATLFLPKPTKSGRKRLEFNEKTKKGEQFEGTDYYMQLVQTGDLKLIKVLEPVQPQVQPEPQSTLLKEENQMNQDKLITEQPPTITEQGKVEFVTNADDSQKQLHENDPKKKENTEETDILLNEGPLDGIELI